MTTGDRTVRKEMGYSHADFMRHLPKAMGGADMQVEDDKIHVAGEGGRMLRVELGEESERRIGFFRIPVLPVALHFSGYEETEIAAALERFARAYQKGGG